MANTYWLIHSPKCWLTCRAAIRRIELTSVWSTDGVVNKILSNTRGVSNEGIRGKVLSTFKEKSVSILPVYREEAENIAELMQKNRKVEQENDELKRKRNTQRQVTEKLSAMISDILALNHTIEKIKSLIENMENEIATSIENFEIELNRKELKMNESTKEVENMKNYVIQLEQGRAEYGLRNQAYQ
ncbi:hypothetical protein WA026_023774 [Henosepilachna vigintioctopunctata]|uniref:Uncharacterized protein n=1 Tax=Henosepilachna vigintioctopunctata TaxID=420089 RepID=A0AAW1V2R7_9CUCU